MTGRQSAQKPADIAIPIFATCGSGYG